LARANKQVFDLFGVMDSILGLVKPHYLQKKISFWEMQIKRCYVRFINGNLNLCNWHASPHQLQLVSI
jgi:hypothetical protein